MTSAAPQSHAADHRKTRATNCHRDDEPARGCEPLAFPVVEIVEAFDFGRSARRLVLALLEELGLEGIEVALGAFGAGRWRLDRWKPAAGDAIHLILSTAFCYGRDPVREIRREA